MTRNQNECVIVKRIRIFFNCRAAAPWAGRPPLASSARASCASAPSAAAGVRSPPPPPSPAGAASAVGAATRRRRLRGKADAVVDRVGCALRDCPVFISTPGLHAIEQGLRKRAASCEAVLGATRAMRRKKNMESVLPPKHDHRAAFATAALAGSLATAAARSLIRSYQPGTHFSDSSERTSGCGPPSDSAQDRKVYSCRSAIV